MSHAKPPSSSKRPFWKDNRSTAHLGKHPYRAYIQSEHLELRLSTWCDTQQEDTSYYFSLILDQKLPERPKPLITRRQAKDFLAHEAFWAKALQKKESQYQISTQEIRSRFTGYLDPNQDLVLESRESFEQVLDSTFGSKRDISVPQQSLVGTHELEFENLAGAELESRLPELMGIADLEFDQVGMRGDQGGALQQWWQVQKKEPRLSNALELAQALEKIESESMGGSELKRRFSNYESLLMGHDFGSMESEEQDFFWLKRYLRDSQGMLQDEELKQGLAFMKTYYQAFFPDTLLVGSSVAGLGDVAEKKLEEDAGHDQVPRVVLFKFQTQSQLKEAIKKVNLALGLSLPDFMIRHLLVAPVLYTEQKEQAPQKDFSREAVPLRGKVSQKPLPALKPLHLQGIRAHAVTPSLSPCSPGASSVDSFQSGRDSGLSEGTVRSTSSSVKSAKDREKESIERYLQRQPNAPQKSKLTAAKEKAPLEPVDKQKSKKIVRLFVDELGKTRQEKAEEKFLERLGRSTGSRPASRASSRAGSQSASRVPSPEPIRVADRVTQYNTNLNTQVSKAPVKSALEFKAAVKPAGHSVPVGRVVVAPIPVKGAFLSAQVEKGAASLHHVEESTIRSACVQTRQTCGAFFKQLEQGARSSSHSHPTAVGSFIKF